MSAFREITFAGRKRAAEGIARLLAVADNRWRAKPYVSEARPIIIGGCPRSGTTLLRVMLDSHPNLCCGPESNLFLPHRTKPALMAERFDMNVADVRTLARECGSKAEFIERLFARYATRAGKQRWAEKTPANVLHIDWIFAHFPQARFIHVVRDGRDTICSLRTHPKQRAIRGRLVPVKTNNPINWCIETWKRHVEAGRKFAGDGRVLELRYEDLIQDAESCIRTVLEFLDEPWHDQVLEYHRQAGHSRNKLFFPQSTAAQNPITSSSRDRWRDELASDEVALFDRIAGDINRALGYPHE